MKRLALCVLGLHLALVPCFADVIPSRRAEKDAASEQALKSRLQNLGMTDADAQRHVSDLTAQETAYFAQNPDRVQVAGGLYWYEWIIGATVLTVVVITYILLDIDYK